MAARSSRRDFLKGKAAADALTETIQAAVPTPNPLDPAKSDHQICVAREAMACEFEIRLDPRRFPHGTEAALDALDVVSELERRWSFFRDESEITAINTHAAEGPVRLSDDLYELLLLAERISEETNGAFDITSGPLAEVWGFSGRRGRVPEQEELSQAMTLVGGDLVELDAGARTVRYRKAGVKINLGSIGKGWAVDRVAGVLEEKGIDTFLIHGGNSSVLARIGALESTGTPRRAREPWEVGIAHPLRKGVRLGVISLENGALATSGSARQFFMHKGRRLGHVIDPRTGWPNDRVLSVTVLCGVAAEADALATGFFVLGPEEGEAYCRGREDVGMVFVLHGPTRGCVEVRRIGRVSFRRLEPE
jgi:FAD:protein FMN transferase